MAKFTTKFAGQYPLLAKPEAYTQDPEFVAELTSEIYKAVEHCGDMEDCDISAFFGSIFDFYDNKLDMGHHCKDLLEVRDIGKLPDTLRAKIGELARDAYEYMPGDAGNHRVIESFVKIYRRNPDLILPLLNDLFPIGAIEEDMAQDFRSQDDHWEGFHEFLKDPIVLDSDYRILKGILEKTVKLNVGDALPAFVDAQAHTKVAKKVGQDEETLKSRALLELDVDSFLEGKPQETPLSDAIQRTKDSLNMSSDNDFEQYAEVANFLKTKKLAAEMLKKLQAPKTDSSTLL